MVQEYPCKNKTCCLVQLGGLPILYFGLTHRKGGFVEGELTDLQAAIEAWRLTLLRDGRTEALTEELRRKSSLPNSLARGDGLSS